MNRFLLGTSIAGLYLDLAAIARTIGNGTVVTMDGDFAAVPGLAVENWATG